MWSEEEGKEGWIGRTGAARRERWLRREGGRAGTEAAGGRRRCRWLGSLVWVHMAGVCVAEHHLCGRAWPVLMVLTPGGIPGCSDWLRYEERCCKMQRLGAVQPERLLCVVCSRAMS